MAIHNPLKQLQNDHHFKSPESIRLSAIQQTIAKNRPRSNGKFVKKKPVQSIPAVEPHPLVSNSISTSEKGDPPLVNANVKVKNSITYFKKWWNKIIGNEGVEFKSSSVFYLITSSDMVIRLEVPENVNLTKFIGKRILATGRYNKETEKLYVTDAKDLEVLPSQTQVIPMSAPTP